MKREQHQDPIVKIVKDTYTFFKDTRQKRMEIPTDPKEIHRRANEIRERLAKERAEQREKDRIYEDLRLIEFDLKMRQAKPKKEPIGVRGIKIIIGKIRK